MRASILICILLLLAGQGIEETLGQEENDYWPSWRGPLATGEAPNADPPTEWDEATNVKWKIELEGLGHSTPVVWEQHLFLTTAIPFGDEFEPRFSGAPGAHDNLPVSQEHKFVGMAINRDNGEVLWSKTLHQATPHEGAHISASLASASPVTDGKHVYFWFGSYGLYCLDFEGK